MRKLLATLAVASLLLTGCAADTTPTAGAEQLESPYTTEQALAAQTRLPAPEQDSDGWRYIVISTQLDNSSYDYRDLYMTVYRLDEESFGFDFELEHYGDYLLNYQTLGFISSAGEVFFDLTEYEGNETNFSEYGFQGFYTSPTFEQMIELDRVLSSDDITVTLAEASDPFNLIFGLSPETKANLRDLIVVYFGLGEGALF